MDVLFSANEDFIRPCLVGLERELPVTEVHPVGPDAGLVTLDHGCLADVVAVCGEGRLPFVRHLAQVLAQTWNREVKAGPDAVAAWVGESVALTDVQLRGRPVALQVWDSGRAAHEPGETARAVREVLGGIGIETCLAGAEHTLSLCLGEKRTVLGLNRSAESLCDWPGGRIRLGHRPEQVARAEFKLEELFTHVPPPAGEVAIDLGAAPGGWTRILRTLRFAEVHAVDPGELHPSVLADRGVVHHATTAGEFLRHFDGDADLVASDMRMAPRLAARVMNDFADLLTPGGTLVLTLKLGAGDPDRMVRDALDELSRRYEATFVRQLQHNRHEVTVMGRCLR